MALILSLETSDTSCSVALHKSGELLSSREITDDKSSSSHLTLLIEEVLHDVSIAIKELQAIAISRGPGSFTGLRIGVSTCKGMCFALNIPLIAINTLDICMMSTSLKETDLICPMLDARRMAVYCKIQDSQTKFELLETTYLELEVGSLNGYLENGKKIGLTGPGAPKCREIWADNAQVIIDEELNLPKAVNMGFLAFEKFGRKEFEDLVEFEPFYLKDFLVKKSLKKMPLDMVK